MTKKPFLTLLFISTLVLSSLQPLYAQKDSSTNVKQISFEADNVLELKQKIASDPSLSWFAPFFDKIGQLKKANYTITGMENFPPKYRKQLVKQFKKGVSILVKLLDKPEKENNLLPKLDKISEKMEDIVSAAEDKVGQDFGGHSLKIEFPVVKSESAKPAQ